MAKRYWLFKSEPDVFSFEDLKNSPNQTTQWEGVRNYQARNILRDEIEVGDEVFFYHSRQDPMHVAGICKVARAAYPDPHQFDARSKYFDPKSKPDAPAWVLVDLKFHRDFRRPVTLRELKSTPGLESMMLLRKGARLSVQPVTESEWKIVSALGMSVKAANPAEEEARPEAKKKAAPDAKKNVAPDAKQKAAPDAKKKATRPDAKKSTQPSSGTKASSSTRGGRGPR